MPIIQQQVRNNYKHATNLTVFNEYQNNYKNINNY